MTQTLTQPPTATPFAADLLIREPAAEYHARTGEYLTSHLLADFRRCPLLYHQRVLGLVSREDRPAYILGRAAHTLILEGSAQFAADFAVGGPINPKTGQPFGPATKAWAEWAAEQRRTVLTCEQHQLVQSLAQAVKRHKLAAELLQEGTAEGVVRHDYCGVPSQIRIDWFDSHRGITDLKTCDDLEWFEHDARRHGYLHQLAFYRAVLQQAIGLPMPVFLIAVEKKPPHRCGLWWVDNQVLAQAARENEAAIGRLKRCQSTGHWPTGYEEVRLFDSM